MDLTVGLCDPATEPAAGLSPLPGVLVGRVIRFENNVLWRTPVDGDDTPTRSVATDYLCLAATTPEGVAHAQRLAAEIVAATGIELPIADLGDVSKPNRRKIVNELCVRALASRAAQAERRVGHLAEALATLRREHEVILQRFAEVEASVVMQGQQPVQTLCSQRSVETFAELGQASPLGRHAGLDLPFGTQGLYQLGLYVDAEGAEGPLDISIVTRGVSRVLARWTQDLANDKAGWRSWTRPFAMVESHASARLLLAFRGKGVVRIGMGPHHPARRIWLTGANGQSDTRHIAIHALATIPGLRAPDAGGRAQAIQRLWNLENAVQIAPDPEEIPALVTAAPEGGLVVTPMMGQTTVASLGAVVPEGATAVRATGLVAHPDGPLVDFALVVGSADAIRDLAAADQLEQSDMFPGWTTGAAMSPVLLALVLPEAATGQEDLVLVTRISPDSAHDWCARAVFRNVQILTDRETGDAG